MSDQSQPERPTEFRNDSRFHDVLAEREAALDLAFELAGVAWWSWTPDDDRIVWSRHLARLYGRESGWSPPSAAAFFELVHPLDREEKRGALAAALAGGAPYRGQHRVVCPDGSVRWHAVDAIVERRPDGHVSRMLGVVRDLTEQKRLESELLESQGRLAAALAEAAESEARYRFLADHSRDVIARVDADLRYLYVSPSITAVRGWEPEELIGRTIYEFVHPDERPELERQVRARLAAREVPPPIRIARLLCKDGSYRWMETMATMTFDGGEADGYVTVSRDITERRAMEARVAEAEKLEAIGRLAGGLAHELNNALTVIRGNADLLRVSSPASMADAESLGAIEAAVLQAQGITRQLVRLAGRQPQHPVPFAVDDAVTAMVAGLEETVRRPRVLLLRPGATGARIFADRGEFELAVRHLVANAADAIPDAGAVTVRTAIATVTEHDPVEQLAHGRYACVKVADTGVGIPRELHGRVFEPFFSTAQRRGAGLGLAIVRSTMRRMGGAVTFESSEGVGSQFVLWFPLHGTATDEKVAEGDDRSAPRPTGEPAMFRVLLVDDQVAVQRACAQALERAGHTVHTAASGEEALQLLERESDRIDLLISDLAMPGMGGMALLRSATGRWPHLRMLAMSGYADDPGTRHDLADAGIPFLSKPFGAARLLAAVGELRESRQP